MRTDSQKAWTKPLRQQPLPSDPLVVRPYTCECGAVVKLTLRETLPRGWRVELVREWRNGMRVFASWRYTCPECAESVSRSSGN